jgi:hypothetical protein
MIDASFFRTLQRVPHGLRAAAHATALAIEAEAPQLPGAQDEAFVTPPNRAGWRRRVRASTWWVVYTWNPTTETLIVRTVNDFE